MLVLQELAGEVAAAHRHHDLAGPRLGQGVEAADHHRPLVDHRDLLVHDVDGDDRVDDGPQVRDEALAVRAGLELVLSSRMNTVTRTPRPAASCSSGRMPRTRFATHGAHSQTEARALRISSSKVLKNVVSSSMPVTSTCRASTSARTRRTRRVSARPRGAG
ncbi:hypothetical protein [Streptomyces rhizosphaerihabitans]|uniref:hypothetical protein n=1 Tax=Streptomyces rhizosphaerihabitans TaxID=1266770 RepID=UPI003703CC03